MLRVALVSTGLGRVLRGFESFTASLFRSLQSIEPNLDVTLFKGGGNKTERSIVVPNFHRGHIPARWLNFERANLLEKRSFALALYPLLRKGGYDIVHYNELVMGSALFHLRRHFGGKFKLLYCNGAPSPPVHYHHRCDFVQILTRPDYEEASMYGVPEQRLFLVPYGVDSERFSPEVKSQREVIRRKLGIPEDTKIVLTVAALKREHKRIDYLIQEISGLDSSAWLVAAGQRTHETRELEEIAERRLPGRWKFISMPQEEIHLLYAAADVFVLTSLVEAFGRVIIEALMTEMPVIVHNGPVFRWVTQGTNACAVDLSQNGSLKKALETTLNKRNEVSRSNMVRERFSWKRLVPKYVEMYKTVAEWSKN